jgi:hypothetical protein
MKHLPAPLSTLLLTSLLSCLPVAAMAKADCPVYPKSEWLKADEARAKIEDQGYKIKKFQVDGECYEIYGWDKDGKKVEIYFDAKTLAIVKAEVRK